MVNYKQLSKTNSEVVDISDQRALIAGGTQGIGAGIALRFALAGASVWLIGRNEAKADQVLAQLRKASAEAQRRAQINNKSGSSDADTSDVANNNKHEFFKADLSSTKEVARVAATIAEKAGKGGIDYLIETQGGPPHGRIETTDEGIETQFSVQVLSRFGLADILTRKEVIKRGVYMVAAPAGGGKKPIDTEDFGFVKSKREGKWWGGPLGVLAKGAQQSSILDSACQTLAEKNPNLVVVHAFPGFIYTDALGNQGHSSLLVLAGKIFGPLFAYKPGPGGYAELPFHVLTHPQGQKYLETGNVNLIGPFLKKYSISPNVADKQVRQNIWNKLSSYFQ